MAERPPPLEIDPELQVFITQFKRVASAIVDSYFVVDKERRIVDFNRAFYALLPRQVARGLKGKKCFEVVELNICKNECIAEQCWRDNRHVRLDEIDGTIIGDSEAQQLRFILSAVPVTNQAGENVGALEIQRNVTDEAVVQVKYQEMLETEARERERLANQIRARTKELLETNQLLLKTQKELLAYKKGLVA
jgi:PAS domain-containing protein